MAARNLHHVRHLVGQDLVDQVNRIQQELTEQADILTRNVTLGGDTNRLRGIPAIGQGVSGHIPGTNPEDILLSDQAL